MNQPKRPRQLGVKLAETPTAKNRPSDADSLITLLIPMRDFRDAKSRLTCLDDGARAELAQHCFERALIAASTASGFDPVVISDSAEVVVRAKTFGVRAVAESTAAGGFRKLLRQSVADFVPTRTFGILMADLPHISPSDLVLARQQLERAGVVLAPDRHDLGTNLLLCETLAPELLRFGAADSFVQHLDAYASAGVSTSVVKLFGLGFDVDTNEDYRALTAK